MKNRLIILILIILILLYLIHNQTEYENFKITRGKIKGTPIAIINDINNISDCAYKCESQRTECKSASHDNNNTCQLYDTQPKKMSIEGTDRKWSSVIIDNIPVATLVENTFPIATALTSTATSLAQNLLIDSNKLVCLYDASYADGTSTYQTGCETGNIEWKDLGSLKQTIIVYGCSENEYGWQTNPNQLIMDGVNMYMTMPPLGLMSQMTFSVWFNVDSYNDKYEYIYISDNLSLPGSMRISIGMDGSIKCYFSFTKSLSVTAKNRIKTGKWYNFVLTYNQIKQEIIYYLNGIYDNNYIGFNGGPINFSSTSTIGAQISGTDVIRLFTGSFNSLAIYNRILDVAEINKNYLAQKSRLGI